jgi:hypothetical protein
MPDGKNIWKHIRSIRDEESGKTLGEMIDFVSARKRRIPSEYALNREKMAVETRPFRRILPKYCISISACGYWTHIAYRSPLICAALLDGFGDKMDAFTQRELEYSCGDFLLLIPYAQKSKGGKKFPMLGKTDRFVKIPLLLIP